MKANVGEYKPKMVRAEVGITLHHLNGRIRQEWEDLRRHDVIFLITLQSNTPIGQIPDLSIPFKYVPRCRQGVRFFLVLTRCDAHSERFGVKHVRGAEIDALLDSKGEIIPEWNPTVEQKAPKGHKRTLRVLLDAAQFQKVGYAAACSALCQPRTALLQDMDEGREGLYKTFNLVLRRKPKENNFKAVLETIRNLMNAEAAVPAWLHEIFLGYGASPLGSLPLSVRLTTLFR